MNQKQRLLEHFLNFSTIGPLEAWQKLGIYRLSSAILDLREDGHLILTSYVNVTNQFGENCRVAEYVYLGKS